MGKQFLIISSSTHQKKLIATSLLVQCIVVSQFFSVHWPLHCDESNCEESNTEVLTSIISH